MDRWRGRVAVVTGASAGIGAAVCKLLANEGMKVVGCARRLEKVEELAKDNANIYPVKVIMKYYKGLKVFKYSSNSNAKYSCLNNT